MNGITNSFRAKAPDREGFAMVTALLVVLVLSVLAVGVVWLAGTEKKTSFAEAVHVQSVFAADAGGEAAINFLRTSESPPTILDASRLVRNQASTTVHESQSYDFSATNFGPLQGTPRPGWDPKYYRDFDYQIASNGGASRSGSASVALVVSRLYKVGY